LAEFANLEPSEDYQEALDRAIAANEVRPLWFQRAYSGTPEEIIIAYGQGKAVVTYMISTYGEAKMAELFQDLKKSFDIDSALQSVYGFDQRGLDAAWRESVGAKPLEPEEQTTGPVPSQERPSEDQAQKSSPGYSAPNQELGGITDLALLAVLGGPIAMISFQAFRKRVT
jgi:hypothetical protein